MKLPKQLFVTQQDPGIDQRAPLGFLHSYEPGKPAFEKKRNTQMEWAYLYGRQSIRQDGDNWYVKGPEYVLVDPTDPTNRNYKTIITEKLVKFPPVVWDNTPLAGFTVVKSVTRSSTSNKLWRILDPRNVEFEITTDCMEEIIHTADIKKGVIDANCAWLSNKRLVVVS